MLELPPDQRRLLTERAVAFALRRWEARQDAPISPTASPEEVWAAVDEPLPRRGMAPDKLVADFEARIAPHARNNANPRMAGYVASPGLAAGAVGDFLASTLNQNVTSWRSAPGATAVEMVVVRWIAEAMGYAAGDGILTSGGSMANLVALTCALRAKAGADVAAEGVAALPRPVVVYASDMVHMSVPKAAEIMGLGRKAVRLVPSRLDFTLDVDALAAAMDEDERAGRRPLAVVANAGDVSTGAVDDLRGLRRLCDAHDAWLHADGSYGGLAAMAPEGRRRLAGLDACDSVCLDPHKWMSAPLDVGCVLVRDPASLRRAFGGSGDAYIRVLDAQGRADFAFWDHGPELSRRFRALKLWFILKAHGADALAASVGRNMELARRLGERVDAAPDLQRMAPTGLSIVCFRHVPRAGMAEPDLDAHNQRLMVRAQRAGEAYPSNTTLRGRFALRACLVNHETTEADLDRFLDALRRAAGPA